MNINQMSTREKIEVAIQDFKEMGMREFIIPEVCQILELNCDRDSKDYRNISSTLSKLVREGIIYKLRKTRPRKDGVKGGKGYNVYTYSLEYYNQEKASWKEDEPPIPPKQNGASKSTLDGDMDLNYAQIGEAIITRMLELSQEISTRDKNLETMAEALKDKEETIKQQNDLIIKLNGEIEAMKAMKATHSQESFKLGDIARFKE